MRPAQVQHGLLVGGAGDQDGELVAAEPGHRAGRADGGGQPGADLDQQQVAVLVPEGVVDRLELVEVEDHHRRAGHRAGGDVVEHRTEPALQAGAVGQPGERVVQRLVPQLVDQLAVAQRDAGVVGDGLEQQDVVLFERAHVAEPVGHGEDADDAGAAAQRHGHRLAHAVVVQPAAGAGIPGAARHEQRRAALGHLLEHPPVGGARRLLGALHPVVDAQAHPSEQPAVRGHEGDRGPLRAQQRLGLGQHGGHDRIDLRGTAHCLAEPEQPLEVEVLVGE
jgi:hypothetical protein